MAPASASGFCYHYLKQIRMDIYQLCNQQSSLKNVTGFGVALVATSTLSLLQAAGQPIAITDETHVCMGSGQIISGSGVGGFVQLSLTLNHGTISFTSGPSDGVRRNPRWQGDQSTLNTPQGEWELTRDGLEAITALFHGQEEPRRIIEYDLSCEVRDEKDPGSS